MVEAFLSVEVCPIDVIFLGGNVRNEMSERNYAGEMFVGKCHKLELGANLRRPCLCVSEHVLGFVALSLFHFPSLSLAVVSVFSIVLYCIDCIALHLSISTALLTACAFQKHSRPEQLTLSRSLHTGALQAAVSKRLA